ncbi:hypothetical protein BSPLISOX_2867 [uncultured Gammaproteobacteria bacterium]|nr:hypothetical protein BSPLISOX_2867 [uncultured Gammaproteobacteria bacterium]
MFLFMQRSQAKDKNYYTQFRSLSLLKNSPPFAFYTTGDLFFIA